MKSKTSPCRFHSPLPFLFLLLFLAALFFPGFTRPAIAQNFYGEGNVLIAVDMGEFRQNDEVSYPEGTMGTLVWGDAAKEGESTRPAFTPSLRGKSADALTATPPEYETETVYAVGDTRFFPYLRAETPGASVSYAKYTADDLPPELFTPSGEPKFLIGSEYVTVEDGQPAWWFWCENTQDGETLPCIDFLEIRCVVATDSTPLTMAPRSTSPNLKSVCSPTASIAPAGMKTGCMAISASRIPTVTGTERPPS